MPISSPTRRPGGQPGNTNALKHGFYARKFKPRQLDDYARARAVTGLDEEIALLRIIISNLVNSCIPTAGNPPDLAACSVLETSLARLAHPLQDQRLLSLGDTDPAGLFANLFVSANAGFPFTGIFPSESPSLDGPSPGSASSTASSLDDPSLDDPSPDGYRPLPSPTGNIRSSSF